MKTDTFEVALFVSDYAKDCSNNAEAFDRAKEDTEGALDEAKAQLSNFLDDSVIEELTLSAQFVEFDSTNVTHAGAIYEITVTGEDEVVCQIIEEMEDE